MLWATLLKDDSKNVLLPRSFLLSYQAGGHLPANNSIHKLFRVLWSTPHHELELLPRWGGRIQGWFENGSDEKAQQNNRADSEWLESGLPDYLVFLLMFVEWIYSIYKALKYNMSSGTEFNSVFLPLVCQGPHGEYGLRFWRIQPMANRVGNLPFGKFLVICWPCCRKWGCSSWLFSFLKSESLHISLLIFHLPFPS